MEKLIKSFLSIILIICTFGCKDTNINLINPEDNQIVTKQDINYDNCQPNLNVNFVTDERLFTFLAWLNWIGDTSDWEKNQPKFPEQIELINYLKKIPASYIPKHRKAYENFIPSGGIDVKNGLLLLGIPNYDNPPYFKLSFANEKNKEIIKMFNNLPSSEIISEFYKVANIKQIWETKFRRVQENLINKYKLEGTKILKETLCNFNEEQRYPVNITLNTFGYFGVAGQTVFSENEKKFFIKINPSLDDKGFSEDLTIIRHEFSHSLFNDVVNKNSGLINNSLEKVSKELGIKDLPPVQEMLAQCFQFLDIPNYKSEGSMKYAYLRPNLIFMHFMEKLPEFKKSGKKFSEFIPFLFKTYNPEFEIKRFSEIKKIIKQ
jgi:hypothetical protein